jgi:hypothetical protein
MRDDLLEGVRLKIERANAHIRESSALIDAYLAPNPYEAFIEVDTVNRVKRIKLRLTKQPPAKIAVICGEVLYSLRSALDHLVTAVATRRNVVVIKRTGFPIERTREEFETALAQRKIEQRLPALAKALSDLQPYEGGTGDLLWWLHWLNGREKHQIIVTLAGANVGLNVKGQLNFLPEFDRTRDQVYQAPKRWQRLDKDALLLVHPIDTEFEGEIGADMNVVFGDIERPEPHAVTDTLQNMSDLTRGIIDAFEALFFRKAP